MNENFKPGDSAWAEVDAVERMSSAWANRARLKRWQVMTMLAIPVPFVVLLDSHSWTSLA